MQALSTTNRLIGESFHAQQPTSEKKKPDKTEKSKQPKIHTNKKTKHRNDEAETSYVKTAAALGLLLLNPASGLVSTAKNIENGQKLVPRNQNKNTKLINNFIGYPFVEHANGYGTCYFDQATVKIVTPKICSTQLLHFFGSCEEPPFFHKAICGLGFAARWGQVDYAKWYIANGYEYHPRDFTAAVYSGNIEMVQLFINLGYDVNTSEIPPLVAAVELGVHTGKEETIAIVKLLLESGANPNLSRPHKSGWLPETQRPIDILCNKISDSPIYIRDLGLRILNVLLQYKPSLGPCLCSKDYIGYLPLGTAIRNSDVELAEILLKAGANVDERMYGFYRYGEHITPLYLAISQKKDQWVSLFLKYNADVHAKHSSKYQTPMKLAEYFMRDGTIEDEKIYVMLKGHVAQKK